MVKRVKVAIVGAGSAGLAALREVRKATSDFVVIDDGPLGTMCARAGCMPSKALIQVAEDFHRLRGLEGRGILGAGRVRLKIPDALAWVRKLRDGFTQGPVLSAKSLGKRLVRARARLLAPGTLLVGDDEYLAERVILAVGSRPVVPDEFRALGKRVVTTDGLFELEDLPRRIAVIGLGSIGLEIGQALSRLGCDVVAFDRSRGVGTLSDPAVNAYARRVFSREFPIHFGCAAVLRPSGATAVTVLARGRAYERDLILASLGRRPNLDSVGLEALGVVLDAAGRPAFDPETMKLPGLPIYLGGDASARHPVLHEAADDGRIAGANAVRRAPRRFGRRAPLSITFSDPNIALAGKRFVDLRRGRFVAGEASFETDGRSLIMGRNRGLLRVYAGAADGKFLGAEMIGPAGEHLAHLMAWALQRGLTVSEMLRLPFYHPAVEEVLRSALRDASRKLGRRVGRTTGTAAQFSE